MTIALITVALIAFAAGYACCGLLSQTSEQDAFLRGYVAGCRDGGREEAS